MKVFVIPFHVKALEHSIMPNDFGGAYVSCYAQGSTYIEATEKILKKLESDGLKAEEMLEPVYEMDSDSWCEHIENQWPEYIDSLLTQDEFNEAIASDEVVYGPFGSYNP